MSEQCCRFEPLRAVLDGTLLVQVTGAMCALVLVCFLAAHCYLDRRYRWRKAEKKKAARVFKVADGEDEAVNDATDCDKFAYFPGFADSGSVMCMVLLNVFDYTTDVASTMTLRALGGEYAALYYVSMTTLIVPPLLTILAVGSKLYASSETTTFWSWYGRKSALDKTKGSRLVTNSVLILSMLNAEIISVLTSNLYVVQS
jgi:hypothetical protein